MLLAFSWAHEIMLYLGVHRSAESRGLAIAEKVGIF